MPPATSSGARPMAASTWERETLPDEHAEPEDTAIAGKIESHQRRLGLEPRQRKARRVGQSRPGLGEDRHVGRGGLQFNLQPVAQRLDTGPLVRRPQRRGKAGDGGHVLRPGAALQLLPAAMQQRLERQPFAQDQRPGPLRPAELVGRQAHHVDAQHAQRSGILPSACTASL
jgi:hypothetical protein